MVEQTLVIIKPDAVEDKLVGAIIYRIEKRGFKLINALMRSLTPEECLGLYPVTYARLPLIYQRVERLMTQNPSLILLIEGSEAVRQMFALRGPTNLLEAPVGTIRRDLITDVQRLLFAKGKNVKNLMHAPETPEEAEAQIQMFFEKKR